MRYIWIGFALLMGCSTQQTLESTIVPGLIEAPYGKSDQRLPAAPSVYKIIGKCAGLPRIDVKTPAGFCVGQVDAGEDLRFPRGIVSINKDQFVLVDMGGWGPKKGRIFLYTRKGDGTFERKLILDAAKSPPEHSTILDRPSVAILGRDKKVYVGAVPSIWRFDPLSSSPRGTVEILIKDLPNTGEGRHPLKNIAFDDQGRLYVNIGSSSDNCEGPNGELPDPRVGCAEAQGSKALGVLRRYSFKGDGRIDPNFEVVAQGLRNSMALAYHSPTTNMIQGENSRDYINKRDSKLDDVTQPKDEINVIPTQNRSGVIPNHGWPYCYNQGVASPEYRKIDCSRFVSPHINLDAHVAPLSMLIYRGSLFPSWYQNKLIVAYHGYREKGHRLVVFNNDEREMPQGEPLNMIWGWDARGTQAMGAPTSISEMPDGTLLLSEDKNKKVLLVSYDAAQGNGMPVGAEQDNSLEQRLKEFEEAKAQKRAEFENRLGQVPISSRPLFSQIQSEVLDKHCALCHGQMAYPSIQFFPYDDRGNAKKLLTPRGNGLKPLVVPGRPEQSEFYLRISAQGASPRMPPMGLGSADEQAKVQSLIERWIREGAVLP